MPRMPKVHRPRHWQPDGGRPNAASRGYGWNWQKLRPVVLVRDGWLCRVCGRPAGKSAHVDHIVPKRQGGTDELDNLQTLCQSCHSRKTAHGT